MDNPDRTRPTNFEVPDHLLEHLRAAAEDELERACDNGGQWDKHIRTRVLGAARAVEAFDLATLSPGQLAALADRALRLAFEDQIPPPAEMEDVADLIALTGISRELIALRDAASAAAPSPDATRPEASA
jgi:hypothetical protein